MAGVELPEDRQQRLVGEQHLPGRLDPAGGAGAAAVVEGVQDVRAEAVGRQPLPRVELEAAADEAQTAVDEAAREPVPADLFDGQRLGGDAGLLGGLTQVRHRHQVLAELVALRVDEVQRPGRQERRLAPPRVDEPLVQGVPLVGAGEALLHPEPLRAGRLHQRGGRVGVVLQHLGGARAVVPQVEPPVDGGEFGPSVPGDGHARGQFGVRDAEVGEAVVLDDVRGGGQAHGVQFLDDLLHRLDLGQREFVVRALVPVRAQRPVGEAGQRIDEALLLDGPLPAGAGFDRVSLHR